MVRLKGTCSTFHLWWNRPFGASYHASSKHKFNCQQLSSKFAAINHLASPRPINFAFTHLSGTPILQTPYNGVLLFRPFNHNRQHLAKNFALIRNKKKDLLSFIFISFCLFWLALAALSFLKYVTLKGAKKANLPFRYSVTSFLSSPLCFTRLKKVTNVTLF